MFGAGPWATPSMASRRDAGRTSGKDDGRCPTTDRYAAFPDLTFDRPAEHVLRITLDGPGLNAVGPAVHRQLADVWLTVDRDPDTNVASCCRAPARRSRPAAASS